MKPLITLAVLSLVVLSCASFEDSSYKNSDETITIASNARYVSVKDRCAADSNCYWLGNGQN